jgi:hypothetical protein
MEEWLEKAEKFCTLADASITGILMVLGILALLARAIYLAWK